MFCGLMGGGRVKPLKPLLDPSLWGTYIVPSNTYQSCFPKTIDFLTIICLAKANCTFKFSSGSGIEGVKVKNQRLGKKKGIGRYRYPEFQRTRTISHVDIPLISCQKSLQNIGLSFNEFDGVLEPTSDIRRRGKNNPSH